MSVDAPIVETPALAASSARAADHAARLLRWYDANARTLPWRSPPGQARPDPYRVWLSEIMLQQTTVASVTGYFSAFTARWPTVDALAAAADADVMQAWAGLGYYARARNLLACARQVVSRYGGQFPDTEDELRSLPGIGRYAAAAVAAIAFDRPATVVDGNVERVVARLFAETTAIPAAKPRLHARAQLLTPDHRAGDYAQAMMDLGATRCTPRRPACGQCPISVNCAGHATGTPEAFPVKAPKPPRPVRHGTAYWLESNGSVLVVQRPPKGLLGGMRAFPSDAWGARLPTFDPPCDANWQLLPAAVHHVFTHFELHLAVAVAQLDATEAAALPVTGAWLPIAEIERCGLPTLFAKAARLVLANRARHGPQGQLNIEAA